MNSTQLIWLDPKQVRARNVHSVVFKRKTLWNANPFACESAQERLSGSGTDIKDELWTSGLRQSHTVQKPSIQAPLHLWRFPGLCTVTHWWRMWVLQRGRRWTPQCDSSGKRVFPSTLPQTWSPWPRSRWGGWQRQRRKQSSWGTAPRRPGTSLPGGTSRWDPRWLRLFWPIRPVSWDIPSLGSIMIVARRCSTWWLFVVLSWLAFSSWLASHFSYQRSTNS